MFKRITKEIVKKDYQNIYPLISRDSMAKKINGELDLMFEYKKIIVFSKKIEKEKLYSILDTNNFVVGNFFKADYKDFNEKSLSVAIIENISFEQFKDIVNEIFKKFKQDLLVRFEFNVYLLTKWEGKRYNWKKGVLDGKNYLWWDFKCMY